MIDAATLLWCDSASTAVAAARALATGAIIGAAAPWVAALLARRRPLAWVALLALAVAPPLLAGYAYSGTALVLVHHRLATEALLVLLLAARALPFVAAAATMARPRCSPAALHAWKLALPMRHGTLRDTLAIHAAGPLGARLVWALAAASLAFADVELASLLGRDSWTVAVFDAQAGGEPLDRTLLRCALPVALQLAALGAALALARRALVSSDHAPEEVAPSNRGRRGAAVLVVSLAAYVLVPAAAIGREAVLVDGWARIARPMGRDLAAAALFALASTTVAVALARQARSPGWAAALALPGLVGALPLALAIAAACRTPALEGVRGGPLPLLLAQTLLLLPGALLLDRLAADAVPPAGRTLARHLAGSPDAGQARAGRHLAWRLGGRARAAVAFALFGLAYSELPAGSLLAPVGFAPFAGRLYNLAHYGRSAALSAMFAIALAIPLVVAFVGARVLAPRRP